MNQMQTLLRILFKVGWVELIRHLFPILTICNWFDKRPKDLDRVSLVNSFLGGLKWFGDQPDSQTGVKVVQYLSHSKVSVTIVA